MLIDAPVPFSRAVRMLEEKQIMPTNLSSADLSLLSTDVRQRAFFSARNSMEGILDTIKNKVSRILNPDKVAGPTDATTGLDAATARLEIKNALKDVGYTPEAGFEGTIRDLGSDQRIALVVQTNVEMAQGYGKWRTGQDPDLLDAFPAQELYRLGEREQPRDWPAIWAQHGGQLRGGKMIALKNDPIWEAISAFKTPWPPFDFNSGMWVKDVARDEAVSLGLIEEDAVVKPQEKSFGMALSE